MQIWFYFRECQIGDLVYYDGTYSDIYNPNKTAVGVCFYIDPKNKNRRLMVGLKNVTGYSWGLCLDSSNSNGFANITLADSPSYNVFNTPLPDYSGAGYVNDENILDPNEPDGFKVYAENDPLGDLGFRQLDEELKYGELTYKPSSFLPRGLYNTLLVLTHRDKICHDSSINLDLPYASKEETEMQNLNRLLSEIMVKNSGNKKYKQFYYPAFSYCYAYQPNVGNNESLSEKFKAHNWFLPTKGDLGRIMWYWLKDQADNKSKAIFSKWYELGIFDVLSTTEGYFWASNENGIYNAWFYQGVYERVLEYGYNKYYDNRIVRPVCAF